MPKRKPRLQRTKRSRSGSDDPRIAEQDARIAEIKQRLEAEVAASPKLKQAARNVLHLRLDQPLRERLQQAADAHRFPLVREIRYRLEDSLDAAVERENKRSLEDIRLDMEICWARFSTRFLRMELADELADAVTKGDAPEKIKTLARLIIEHRATEQRPSSSIEGVS